MRDKIISAAMECFLAKGYHGTSVNELAEKCHIRKPSVFHYFNSKESIALEVIGYIQEHCNRFIFTYSENKSTITDEKRAKSFLKALDQYFIRDPKSQLVGLLARELRSVSEVFEQPIQQYYDAWKDAIEIILSPFHSKAETKRLVRESLVQIHGTVLMAQILGDDEYLKNAPKELEDLWLPE
ncbi:MAG: TetR/AcrR family transcriptional regulator [Gammaproteobacteria bacterium]